MIKGLFRAFFLNWLTKKPEEELPLGIRLGKTLIEVDLLTKLEMEGKLSVYSEGIFNPFKPISYSKARYGNMEHYRFYDEEGLCLIVEQEIGKDRPHLLELYLIQELADADLSEWYNDGEPAIIGRKVFEDNYYREGAQDDEFIEPYLTHEEFNDGSVCHNWGTNYFRPFYPIASNNLGEQCKLIYSEDPQDETATVLVFKGFELSISQLNIIHS